jgi:hypothetical protein
MWSSAGHHQERHAGELRRRGERAERFDLHRDGERHGRRLERRSGIEVVNRVHAMESLDLPADCQECDIVFASSTWKGTVTRAGVAHMKDKLLSVFGSVASAEGKFLGWSDEQRKFCSSGYRCPKCQKRLLNSWGIATIRFHDRKGERVPPWLALLQAETAQCPECRYRWRVKKGTAPTTVTVLETERAEEALGSDTRVIDNSRSGVTLTRKFTITKEWSKTYSIECEKATVSKTGLSIGIDELSSLTAGFEETLRERFCISRESKEVYAEEIEIQVPGSKKLVVTFDWKRIWQLGFLQFRDLNQQESKVPFRVVVGVTFDQSQVDVLTAGEAG